MSTAAVAFTETRVKALTAPPGARIDVPDAEVPGLRLRVSATAKNGKISRSWTLLRRVDGKLSRVTLGKWPAVTVDAARTRARVLLGQIAEGRNPAAEKKRERHKDRTLAEAFDGYLEARRLKLKPRTIACYKDDYRLTLACLADRPITSITRGEIQKLHRERSAVSPSRADGAMRLLSAIMNWAADDMADDPEAPPVLDNPTHRLRAQRLWNNVERRQTLIPLPRLGGWIDAATQDVSHRMSHYLLFLLLTGTRRREVDRLEWSAVDLDLATVKLKVKGGRSVKLPLPTQLAELLKIRRAITPRSVKWVFAGSNTDKHVADPRRALARIGEVSGVYVTSHDLRRTFATVAVQVGVPPVTLKNLMNHLVKGKDVTEGYIVQDTEILRPWSQRVADYMFDQLAESNSKVVKIKRDLA